jgi:hypothetical protein
MELASTWALDITHTGLTTMIPGATGIIGTRTDIDGIARIIGTTMIAIKKGGAGMVVLFA